MSDSYELVKAGRLTFKGGALATRKSIDKKQKKKKKKQTTDADESQPPVAHTALEAPSDAPAADDIYSIDAAKKLKYDQLFPVEAKKFGYQPKSSSKSVEEVLDDRVKKKADRYCK